MKQKIYDTLYGAIVGDALGVPVEFCSRDELRENPVKDMLGYGSYNVPKGSWSDDSSMSLCLADSIGKLKAVDYEDIMERFWNWYSKSEYTPDNCTFDIGRTCHAAIMNYHNKIKPVDCGLKTENDNGNGSLMRISPLPFFLLKKFGENAMEKQEAFELIGNVSKLTHAHEISVLGCDIYCSMMMEILKGTRNKLDIQENSLSKINAFVHANPEFEYAEAKYGRLSRPDFKELPEDEIRSSGYAVDTLEAAFWCFLNTENYADCVLKAVNLGSDTDTVACVAGSIAGAYYGKIPENWIKAIRNKKLVDKVINEFAEAVV